jgi:hypothetical protein
MKLFKIDLFARNTFQVVLPAFLLLLTWLSFAVGVNAQLYSVDVRVWGGQQDDRGVRLIPLENGNVLSLSSTNSTSDDQPQVWAQRLDSAAQIVWETTLSNAPLLQPVDAVEHADGRITVLSMRYANAADGYDWSFQTLDSLGVLLNSQSWGTAAWDIPLRCFDRSGELWSVGTSYATGSGDIQWTRHVWNEGNWALVAATSWGSDAEEVLRDAHIQGDTLLAIVTLEGEQRAQLISYDLNTESINWTYSSVWDIPTDGVALEARGSTIAALMNVITDEGSRLAMVCMSLAGDTLLEKIPGSGVDVAAFDLQWYSDSDFATISMTEGLGLGGEELLFSRWSAETGAWQGGPTFGTPWDERPASMLTDDANRIWILGRSDGYSNGRDDVYLLQIPDAYVGLYAESLETNILDVTLGIERTPSMRSADWSVFPNPVSGTFEISGYQPGQRWIVVDSQGRVVAHGQQPYADASCWPAGMFSLICVDAREEIGSSRVLKLNVFH